MDSNTNDVDVEGDYPMYSRLFILCDKNHTENDFRNAFSKFGQIQDIKILNSKGICFIQYAKTSHAANALEAMNMKYLPRSNRPLKVDIAVNPSEIESKDYCDEKYKRIFIAVPKCMKEEEIEEVFASYGNNPSVLVVRDQNTGDSKGFAYVTYNKFSAAARAVEMCDRKYRPIFAKPKASRHEFTEYQTEMPNKGHNKNASLISMMNTTAQGYTKVHFMGSPHLARFHYERLFDMIPGLIGFTFSVDTYENSAKGCASYSNSTSAAYAVEKLDKFEYPCPGQFIFVKPDHSSFNPVEKQIVNNIPRAATNLRNAILSQTESGAPDLAQLTLAIAEAQKLVKAATGMNSDSGETMCSVPLPPPKPLADIDSSLAKRCFLVCKPSPPPLTVLRDIFSRFGDLINVYTLPNKTVGYARYASVAAADAAIKTLHGAEICGVRIKVLEADDEAPPKKRRYNY